MDINDDGRIDMRDITQLCINFMATGDPTKYVFMTHPPYQVLRIFNNENITIVPNEVVEIMSDWISVGGYHKGIVYFQIDWGDICAYGPWALQLDVINAIDDFEWWNRFIWVQHYYYNPAGKVVYNTTIPFEGAKARIWFGVRCFNTNVYVPYILLNMSLYMRD
jgi:hypothetical protein